MDKKTLNTIRGLFLLFTQTHSSLRACKLIALNFKCDEKTITELLKEEIENNQPIKKTL